MSDLYPLRFEPIFRRYLWGGRRLGELLHKPIGAADDYAESWEVVDHGNDQSVVAHGALAGRTLHEIVADYHEELFGRHSKVVTSHGETGSEPADFPLLFKLLDCNRNLSLQVHPNDDQAARLDPPDLGKTEAWVILDAIPGSKVYAGLMPGVDKETLQREVAAGRADACLHQFQPQAGDCIFIPAGTVHALGEGLLVAEIQQASDTTFRLFDWNRVGADGQPRELHIDQSLAVIDYGRGPMAPQSPQTVRASDTERVERLVECDKFLLDRRTFSGAAVAGGDERFHILNVLAGEVSLASDSAEESLTLGQTALVPASVTARLASLQNEAVVLDAYLP